MAAIVEQAVTVTDPEVGDLTFSVRTAGPVDGTPVLFLHGFPQTARSWDAQLSDLGNAGFRAVAFDQRGYSSGARPADVGAYGQDQLVRDVLAVADALGVTTFHLVGHDWGGAVAWQVAGRHPERVTTLTVLSTPHPGAFARALGIDPAAGAVDRAAVEASGNDQAGRSSYIAFFQQPDAQDLMLGNDKAGLRLVLQGSGLTEDQAAPYVEALGTPEALGAALNWYRAASLTDLGSMGAITMPTMYVWSTEDVALGRDAAEATGDFVDGPYRFEVLEGVSHWIAEQAPEATNALLRDHLGSPE